MVEKKFSGVSMSEYALVAGLVLLLVIPGLSSLGDVLNKVVSNMLPAMAKSSPTSPALVSLPPAVQPSPSLPVNNPVVSGGQFSGKTIGVSFRAGNGTVDLPNYPSNIQETVQTIGANGATELLSDQLEILAKQLLQKGAITEQQANALIFLANKGHTLADMEKGLESSLKSGQNSKALNNVQIVMDVRSFRQDGDPMGNKTTQSYNGILDLVGKMDVELATGKPSSNLLYFKNAWDAAERSGAMTNPNVKAIVNQLAGTIYDIANEVGKVTKDFARDKISSPTDVVPMVAAQQTHDNSAGICMVGNGRDSGIHCSTN